MKTKITFNLFIIILLFVVTVQAQEITNFTTADGLIGNNVNCIAIDDFGVVYFGTQDGVSYYDGTNWTSITQSNSPDLVDNNVLAIVIDTETNPDVTYWFGTDFGITQTDALGMEWNVYDESTGLESERIRFLGKDFDGNIWAGTSKGVSVFDGDTWQNFGTTEGIPFGGVNHIDFQSDNTKWLSTGLGGVVVMDPNNVIVNSITEDQGLLNDKVRGITSDIENNKWVATSDGIVVINNQDVVSTYHTRPYTLPPPDTLNPVVAVEANTQGCIWAGIYVDYLVTVGGVSLWDGIEWMEFDEADGLIGPVIQCVAVDFEDNVWVGTSTGVSKIVHPCEIMTNVRAPKISVEFEVFPNPVNQVLHVKWGDDFISKIQDVKLYDASMKMVGIYSVDAFQNELQINMSSMSEGVYFVGVGDSFEKVVK